MDDTNNGFKIRKSLLKTSNTTELIGKIHSELFNQERLLLSNVDLKLVFTRHNDNFCLMTAAAEEVKIEVIDAWLMIICNTLSSHKVIEIESTLLKQDVKYFIPRVEVKTYTYTNLHKDCRIYKSETVQRKETYQIALYSHWYPILHTTGVNQLIHSISNIII